MYTKSELVSPEAAATVFSEVIKSPDLLSLFLIDLIIYPIEHVTHFQGTHARLTTGRLRNRSSRNAALAQFPRKSFVGMCLRMAI